MNTETQSCKLPGWLRAWLAVGTAIVVFRIARLAMAALFFCIQTNSMGIPLVIISRIINFLHRWDSVLVPGISLAIAVLASRWVEIKFLTRSRGAGLVASLLFTGLAGFPLNVWFGIQPIMESPLEFAIRQHYSMETVEAIIDRYPRLINGSDLPRDQEPPLAIAAYEAKTNLVELLIRKGANVDAAVARLQQLKAESAVKLVLDCSKNHNNVTPANGASPHR